MLNKKNIPIMKQFLATRINNGDIVNIIFTLNYENLTLTETWYFDGRIYRKETSYYSTKEDLLSDYNFFRKMYINNCLIELI